MNVREASSLKETKSVGDCETAIGEHVRFVGFHVRIDRNDGMEDVFDRC